MPFVLAVRDTIYNRLEKESDLKRAWIISGSPSGLDREMLGKRFNADVILLPVPLDECLRRIRGDESRPDSADIIKPWIESWWRKYTPYIRDVTIK